MRRILLGIIVGASIAAVTPAVVRAQDVEYQRALERAQQQRPATLTSTARIAPASEPGTPLVLHGKVVKADGSAAADAIVFAYHTDRGGLYDRREAGPHSWRLRGWARAQQDGTFTFETIRPGSYPEGNNPAHVHFAVFLPSGERYHAGEIQFANDPLIGQSARDTGARDEFAAVRPVRNEGKTEHVSFGLRLSPRNKF
jgi:protocatechuate 3,4-dioxygenase beta subunit